MNHSLFTPGPWEARVRELKDLVQWNIYAPLGPNGAQKRIFVGNHYGREGENAHLIAAAPDLFAACQRALIWLAKAQAEGIHANGALPKDLPCTMAMLADAIAKAEGKETRCDAIP